MTLTEPTETPKKDDPIADFFRDYMANMGELRDITYTHSIGVNLMVGAMRVLIDKGVITPQEIAAMFLAAQEQGFRLIGLEPQGPQLQQPQEQNQDRTQVPEMTSEEYYAKRGIGVYAGPKRG